MKPRCGWCVGVMALGLLVVLQQQALGQENIPPDEKYAPAVRVLEAFIKAEIASKDIPGLSIALVDGGEVVWAQGFGFADLDKKTRVTTDTVFPVGSVSKPITALLMLLLARDGKVDLDAPVAKYLAEFKPSNPFKEPVTIRQLLAHCSGLVREPPVGNYFEPDKATRKDLVESLNKTTLTHRPGEKYNYSNAAFATAGYLIETVAKQRFEDFAAARIFRPLDMQSSSFHLTDKVKGRVAIGNVWTQYGRTFPHPTVDYAASAPAGGLYTTVRDMGKLIPALYTNSKDDGPFQEKELKMAFTPQFPKIKAERTYGLAFMVGELEGKKRVGHGGAVNACATELAVLPAEQLGVIVCSNKESANIVMRRIADSVLRHALAVRSGKPPLRLETSTPLKPGLARTLAGWYKAGSDVVEIVASGDRAWLARSHVGNMTELRTLGVDLIGDDPLAYGPKVVVKDNGLEIERVLYKGFMSDAPKAIPQKWKGLIGEYGSDTDVLFVLEKDGKPHLLTEWFFLYPLVEEDSDRFRLPNFGLYVDEPVVFHRQGAGRAEAVTVGGVKFKRRMIDGEDGSTFRIKPLRPIGDIRKDALEAKPPNEKGDFRKPDLVDLAQLDPTIKFDIRYASDNNFMGAPLYTSARAFLQRPAAEALLRAHKRLAEKGYGIQVFDAYRPWYVTKMFWEATPEAQRVFVADPAKGSRHNRGCAIDVTLYDLKTGMPVEMVSGFDEFSDRAYPDYPGGTSIQRFRRGLLREAMEAEGFSVYEAEWWHFDYHDWRHYPILNARFEDLR